MNSELLTITEAAEVLGLGRQMMYWHARLGNLPATKFNDVWAFRRKDVEAFKAKRDARKQDNADNNLL